MSTATDQEVIDTLASAAYACASRDWDISTYAIDVEALTKHMLENRVRVMPASEVLSLEAKEMMRVLLDYYFEFAIITWNPDVAGSLADYCVSAMWDAFNGYEVEAIVDPAGMLEDIAEGMQCALNPDKVYSELASIGVS